MADLSTTPPGTPKPPRTGQSKPSAQSLDDRAAGEVRRGTMTKAEYMKERFTGHWKDQ